MAKTAEIRSGFHSAVRQTTTPPLQRASKDVIFWILIWRYRSLIKGKSKEKNLPVMAAQNDILCFQLPRKIGNIACGLLQAIERKRSRGNSRCILHHPALVRQRQRRNQHEMIQQRCRAFAMTGYAFLRTNRRESVGSEDWFITVPPYPIMSGAMTRYPRSMSAGI